MMKKKTLVLLLICLASLTACSGRPDPGKVSSPSQSRISEHSSRAPDGLPDEEGAETEKSVPSAAREETAGENASIESENRDGDGGEGGGSLAGNPDGGTKKRFTVDLIDIDGNEKGDAVQFSIALPEAWTADGNALYADGRKAAEILPCIFVEGEDAFGKISARYPDADPIREVTVGQHSGRYYHLQSEIERDGLTAIQNELIYFLHYGDGLLQVPFYPASGIGTQRQEFESVLASIE